MNSKMKDNFLVFQCINIILRYYAKILFILKMFMWCRNLSNVFLIKFLKKTQHYHYLMNRKKEDADYLKRLQTKDNLPKSLPPGCCELSNSVFFETLCCLGIIKDNIKKERNEINVDQCKSYYFIFFHCYLRSRCSNWFQSTCLWC